MSDFVRVFEVRRARLVSMLRSRLTGIPQVRRAEKKREAEQAARTELRKQVRVSEHPDIARPRLMSGPEAQKRRRR
jgi:hypothetical protein